MKQAVSYGRVNVPLMDTGWRVGMPTGSNPPTSTPIHTHRQFTKGAVCKPEEHCLRMYNTRAKKWQRSFFVNVQGYGVFGK